MVPRNALLRSLSAAELRLLQPYLHPVALPDRAVLHELGKPFDHVYFVEAGVVSLMSGASSEMIQTATVSQRGAFGVTLVCGSNVATHHATVLVSGAALRITTRDLQRVMAAGHSIQRILLNSTVDLLEVGCQTALCAATHTNEQRLASWLAATAAALDGGAIPITHARLSDLLGLRRAGLTEALSRFEMSGMIRKSRGHILVCSLDNLRLAACGCYRAAPRSIDISAFRS